MREDAVPQALIGGGMRSTRPAAVQIWLLQWAPGASLAGWASAAVAVERMPESGSTATFILLGMILGSALWAAVAICSLPLFFLIRPWIDRLARGATRLRGAVLAVTAAIPFFTIAVLGWIALTPLQNAAVGSGPAAVAVLTFCVTLGVGTVAAAEMWHLTFPPSLHGQSRFNECSDITLAVRVKEDLEVIRLLLANSAMALLSMLTAILPLAIVGIVVLAYQGPRDFEGVRWVSFVPLAIVLLFVPLLIVLASYQAGLWYLVSVRASGVLLFVTGSVFLISYLAAPFQELYAGSFAGYSSLAWVHTVSLCLLSLPGLAVISSVVRMALRLARFDPHLDSVVRGWRAWPTNVFAPSLRALCVPSFLVALPRGRFQTTFLFVVVVVLSALQTALVLGPVLTAPELLTSVVSAELRDAPTGPNNTAHPTVGAKITAARPSREPETHLVVGKILLALPFLLILGVLLAAATLNRRLAAKFVRVAQSRAAAVYQTIAQHDTRAPILFLRSFKEEKRLLEPPARSLVAKVVRLRDAKRTLDEIVLDAASAVGPVVALGMPGEKVAPLGAARFYADSIDWQSTVRGLAQRSRAIIICVEEGEGVLWELQHLLAETYLTKTLCILSPETASATILRAIQETRESGNARACDILQRIRAHSSQTTVGRPLVGVWFPRGVVTPIFAEDGSDYAHWCMVNLLLTELTSG